jgi:ribosomal protein S18 acetylase RimI-like enzyme
MTELAVRSFEDGDEGAVIQLWDVCFPGDPSWNRPEDVIQRKCAVQRELFLVGDCDGRVVCTAMAGYDGFRGWVYHVATHPEFRRRGFGRIMMLAVEEGLRAIGCPKLNLQVRASNDEVVAFYNSLGYATEERLSFGKRLE